LAGLEGEGEKEEVPVDLGEEAASVHRAAVQRLSQSVRRISELHQNASV